MRFLQGSSRRIEILTASSLKELESDPDFPVGVFLLAFYGLAYSLFPWLVIDKLNIWQAATAPEAMGVILVGAGVVLPVIVGYTIFAYRVFWGKSTALKY